MTETLTLTLILGVHRSGTSLLTQGLRALGARAGEFAETRDPDNPEGYAEHPAVRQFNDRLLAHLGASWDNWGFRAGAVDWDAPALAPWRDEAVAILRGAFAGSGPFVLKDPRCATLAPFWERAVPQAGFALRRILILRDPVEVAESQRQRVARRPHEFPVIAEAEPMAALWAVTMTECLAALSGDDTLVLGHAALLAEPEATLAAAAAFAGLAPDASAVARFAAEGVKPALYRARPPARAQGDADGPWMEAARALFADLTRAGLPRLLPAAEAHAVAAAQHGVAALRPGLAAVKASIARMQAVDAECRVRSGALERLIWILAPLARHGDARSLAKAIDQAIGLAGTGDLPRASFAYAHTIARLLMFADRRSEAMDWLRHLRPYFGHIPIFVQIENDLTQLASPPTITDRE